MLDLSGSLWIRLDHSESLWITWDHSGSLGITRNLSGSLRITQNHLGELRITWNHLGSLLNTLERTQPAHMPHRLHYFELQCLGFKAWVAILGVQCHAWAPMFELQPQRLGSNARFAMLGFQCLGFGLIRIFQGASHSALGLSKIL